MFCLLQYILNNYNTIKRYYYIIMYILFTLFFFINDRIDIFDIILKLYLFFNSNDDFLPVKFFFLSQIYPFPLTYVYFIVIMIY